MNENQQLVTKFYTAFANADAETMCECYHPEIKFRDPVFGLLMGDQVSDMWKMLIAKSKGNIKIEFSTIEADQYLGSAKWIATYNFSKTNREVINHVGAQFHFKDGLIIKHTDDFDIWKWSKQALGLPGLLLGWTGFMHKKIHDNALLSLKQYQKK